MNKQKSININEVKLIDDAKIIDIREQEELSVGLIEGSIHIPMMGLLLNPSEFLEKTQTYYVYCASGMRSANTCSKLNEQGYNLVNLEGGYFGYKK